MDAEALRILDEYLGDLIEDIIERYGYDVDLEGEYEDLLIYIYKRLKRAWFNNRKASYIEWQKNLHEALKHYPHLEVLLSYLISRYTTKRSKPYTQYHDKW